MNKIRFSGYGWLVGIACLLNTPAALAQIGLSPLVIEESAERGRAQGVLTVTNTDSQPLRVRVYAEPFTYDRETGFTTLTASPEDLTPYLQFSPRELVIPAGSSRRVRLIGLLPPSVPEGEYRAAIFAEPLQEETSGNAVGIVTRVGATVYVRQGETTATLAAASAEWQADPGQVHLFVANAGNASARPQVQWQVQQGGQTIAQGLSDAISVMAESDRILPLTPETPLSPGSYQITGELMWRTEGTENIQPFTVPFTVQE